MERPGDLFLKFTSVPGICDLVLPGIGQLVELRFAAAESYEKRQMLWKGMAGRSSTERVQQGGDPPQKQRSTVISTI